MIDSVESSSKKKTIVIGVLLFLVLVLGGLSGWALYTLDQERTTVQQRIDTAVQKARQEQRRADEARFKQERKNPFQTYTAPKVLASISLAYPKSWSVYVEDETRGSTNIDLYMHPDIIRRQGGTDRPLAFRMQLLDELFAKATRTYRRDAEKGDLEANTITVSGIKGVRYKGNIADDHVGTLAALPYRAKTILMWTETNDFRSEFNTILKRADITE